MRSTLIAVLVFWFLFTSVSKSFAQANAQDSLALVDFYNSTNGSEWSYSVNWLTTEPLNTWGGVTVDKSSGRVVRLKLPGFNLTGTILSSLGDLSQLSYLALNGNRITGNIPASMGNISELTFLDLRDNNFTGNIPSEISNLSKLQELRLSNNPLSGAIPSEIGNLSALQILECVSDNLTGNIPASIGNLSQLSKLDIQQNQLSGTIPISLTNLVIFEELVIHHNNFTFSGMEELLQTLPFTYITDYSPQANIPIYNQNNTLSVSSGGTPSNDTFRLYKDGLLQTMQIADSTFEVTATGKYNIIVTNTIATELTLYSDTINITTLPITLSSFSATKKQSSILLSWQTTSEQNNSYFAVERSNNGNTDFKEVGRVNSKGNSSQIQQYSFEDFSPLRGTNYYHLKQVDKDGKTFFSKTMFVDFDKAIVIKLYPNPVKDVLTLDGLAANSKTTISIIDLQGNVLAKTITTNSTYNWNIKQLPAGNYYVRIDADKKVTTMKFVKE